MITINLLPDPLRLVLEPGARFGRLVAIRRVCEDVWAFTCDCGSPKLSRRSNVVHGSVRSCGCLGRELSSMRMSQRHASKPKRAKHPIERRAWMHMKERCLNPHNKQYRDYGGRGISVCDRWSQSFDAFLVDVGERPTPMHSIERVDNNKGYEPGNVKWALREEQIMNRRNTLWHTAPDGTRMTIKQWCSEIGIPYRVVYRRMYKGWDTERALHAPRRST